jgi:hypothetical protein
MNPHSANKMPRNWPLTIELQAIDGWVLMNLSLLQAFPIQQQAQEYMYPKTLRSRSWRLLSGHYGFIVILFKN